MNKKAYLAPDIDIVELKHYLLCHAQQETRHDIIGTVLTIYQKNRPYDI